MKTITKRLAVKRFETLEEIRDFLNERDEENQFKIEEDNDNIILFDGPSFASAFIGVTLDRRAIYDYNLMLQDFSGRDPTSLNLSEKAIEDLNGAVEFIDFNTTECLDSSSRNYPIIINLN